MNNPIVQLKICSESSGTRCGTPGLQLWLDQVENGQGSEESWSEKEKGPRIDQYFLRSQSIQTSEIQRQVAHHSSQDSSTPVIDKSSSNRSTASDETNDPVHLLIHQSTKCKTAPVEGGGANHEENKGFIIAWGKWCTIPILGVPRCLSRVALYVKGKLQLAISALTEEFKCTKIRLEMTLMESRDKCEREAAPIVRTGRKWTAKVVKVVEDAKAALHISDISGHVQQGRRGIDLSSAPLRWHKAAPS
ncbi:UNVERIFIED_CONTAM: hypothetical protein FKN15_051106 [Acipenser sinensis]